MANKDRPRGMVPYGEVRRQKDYATSGEVHTHDPVKLGADGKVSRCAAGDAIHGVALGNSTASGGERVTISTDPEQLYTMQASAGEVNAESFIGTTADILPGTPSTTFKVSRMELDSSTADAVTPKQVAIIDKDQREDNDYGAKVDLIVKINENQVYGERGSAGV